MTNIKIKGSWSRQKGRLKAQLSNIDDSEDLYHVEEEILQKLENDNIKKSKKKNNFKREVEW